MSQLSKGYTLVHSCWMSEVLVDNGSKEEVLQAISKIPRGSLVDGIMDDNYLLTTPDGNHYTDSQIRKWLKANWGLRNRAAQFFKKNNNSR